MNRRYQAFVDRGSGDVDCRRRDVDSGADRLGRRSLRPEHGQGATVEWVAAWRAAMALWQIWSGAPAAGMVMRMPRLR